MILSLSKTTCALALLFTALAAHADEYYEVGRFGVEGMITEDGFHMGVVRETDAYEVALDFDGSTTSKSASSPGVTRDGDISVEARVGKRWNIGSFNYISSGLSYGTSLFGHQSDISTAGSYSAGPYVGLQRHFSGTNLMLSIYVLPVSYDRQVGPEGNGNSQTVVQYRLFQQGGFGIAFLF